MTPEQFLVWAALFPESLLLVTVRGTILAANGPAGALAGRRAPALAGSRLFDLVTTPSSQVTAYLQACARTRAMLPGALTFATPDGRENACQAEGALLQARTAATEAVLLLRCRPRSQAMQPFDRINQRFQALSKTYGQLQQAHVLLQDQREWFEQTLMSIGDAVITTDSQGRVSLMNAVAEALTGWREEEARGQDISDIFHIVNMPTGQMAENPVHRVLREGRIVGLANHTLLIARDGTSRPIDDSGAPIHTPDGRLLGVVLVFRDVTERVKGEQIMQQAHADLERRVAERTAALEQEMAERQRLEREAQRVQHFALLGRLAAGVSHEIRNPLAAVFLHVDVLSEELQNPSPDSAAEVDLALAEIKEHLARLDDLVQDYLSLVRVGAIERAPQDLGALLPGWAAEWRELAAADGVSLRCKGLASLGQVMCHLSTLRRAILNLIQNGVEAMPAGGTLTLSAERLATHIQLEVRDEGNGMPPDMLSQIFEPLYTTKPGGTGLGLYIVQEIIAAHGGNVSVRSAVGQGTVFTITLPRQAEDFN